jgi:hypothetical protein
MMSMIILSMLCAAAAWLTMMSMIILSMCALLLLLPGLP